MNLVEAIGFIASVITIVTFMLTIAKYIYRHRKNDRH